MPADPTTLFTLIPVTPQPNVDLPISAFPSLERIQATDTVGRLASNRQMTSLEKRDETMRAKINELVELSLSLDTWFLRRDSTNQKDGNGLTAALRARGYPINQVGAPVNATDAARKAEIDALLVMIQALQTQLSLVKAVPTGAVSAFGNGIPADWLLCNGATLTSALPNWADLIPLRDYLANIHGAGSATSLVLPNITERVIIGTSYTDQGNLYGIGGKFGVEQHTLTTAQMPIHDHLYNNPYPLGPFAASLVGGAAGASGPTSSAGGGAAHTNTQPSIVLHYGIKI